MTQLTTENAGELLQPLFDEAGKKLSEQVRNQFQELAKGHVERIEKIEKSIAPEEDQEAQPQVDLNDPVAVKAHLDKISRKPVDLNDAESVRAHLATLEKSSDSDDSDDSDDSKTRIKELEAELAKARRASNLSSTTRAVLTSDSEELSDEDFLAEVNSDLTKKEA